MLIAGTIIGLTLVLIGMIGCVMPILPGPQLAYLGLVIFHFMAGKPFSLAFLLLWLVVMVLIVVVDQFLPMLTTKKFWGSSAGMRGAGIGTVIGLFGGLVGLILGPFFGAWVGEWWVKKDWEKSLKPAFGSLVGILISGILKVAICIFLWWKLLAMAISLG